MDRFLTGRPLRACALAVTVALLGGCATFSTDGGFDAVQSATRSHLAQEVAWVRDGATRDTVAQRVDALLAEPLTVDDAVQIALLNNAGLQAAYEALGIAEAERVAAGRLPNPGLSIGRLTRGSEIEWERTLYLDLARLLTLPMRSEIEQRRFEQVQRAVVLDVVRLAADTRRAYYMAVAARQSAHYQWRAMDAAEAGAELARRMAQAGNWSRLRQAREHAFYADAALAVARAEQTQQQAREHLLRLLGIDGPERLQLPDRLPELPAGLRALADVEQQAMEARIDLQAARIQTEALARHLGLTRRTRVVNVLEAGIVNNGSNEKPQKRGYEIRLELPLFDWGQTRVKAAESRYRQALEQVRQLAVEARSEVRTAYATQATQYAIARHLRDEVVPLKKRISDETLLRYNGMLIGVFELLADARAQIVAVNAAIDAQRDFWIADADMAMALAGTPGRAPQAPTSPLSAVVAGGR
ncbi:MAG TPA: TolC family protein [Thiobacillaceae bacterium]|nr:TolC family protein [Thiobacillaceae bacterium]